MEKKIIIILLLMTLLAMFSCSVQAKKSAKATETGWLTDYQKALDLAKSKNLPILINFTGSDWCIWCKRLSGEVFTQKEFIDWAKTNVVLLKIDFPKSLPQTPAEKAANQNLAQQFKIEGFPTIVLINKDGKEIARTGYQPGGPVSYVSHLTELLKTSK